MYVYLFDALTLKYSQWNFRRWWSTSSSMDFDLKLCSWRSGADIRKILRKVSMPERLWEFELRL